mmetsp:Transcript_11070/g.15593  ORF Transcript_11070/g.15593 Transcript_11070/m.15593 type:complete len:169 (-) Transcript_11070:9805-10311(-)
MIHFRIDYYGWTQLLLIVLSLSLLPSSMAFLPAVTKDLAAGSDTKCVFLLRRRQRLGITATRIELVKDGNTEEEDEFYHDLRKAKKDLLGADIPPEQLKQSAEYAENEFLKAMKEATEEFQTVKEEMGSEAACDLFLGKIRKEDERREREEEDENEKTMDSDSNMDFQ